MEERSRVKARQGDGRIHGLKISENDKAQIPRLQVPSKVMIVIMIVNLRNGEGIFAYQQP